MNHTKYKIQIVCTCRHPNVLSYDSHYHVYFDKPHNSMNPLEHKITHMNYKYLELTSYINHIFTYT